MTADLAVVPLLLRPAAAAAYIGITKRHLEDLLRTGEIPSTKLTPQVRVIAREACDEYAHRIAEQARAEAASA